MEQYFIKLKSDEQTIVVAERHDFEEAFMLADKIFDWVIDGINSEDEAISNFAKKLRVVMMGPSEAGKNEKRAVLLEKWFAPMDQ